MGRRQRSARLDSQECAGYRLRDGRVLAGGRLSLPRQSGAAAVESIFAMVFIVVLLLGVVEVAFVLYARNVVASSAHEGARAVVERGGEATDAQSIARRTVRGSAGGLVNDLRVGVDIQSGQDVDRVTVVVTGRVKGFGPVPLPVTVTSTASSARETASP
jgi:Flp pilus assembly protein TadG